MASRKRLLKVEQRHQFDSEGYFGGRSHYCRIDNTALALEAVAGHVIAAFNLPLADAG